MRAAVVTGDRAERKGLGLVRGALLLGVLAALAILLAPSTASAQITPIPGANDFCDDRWGTAFGTTPRGRFSVTVSPSHAGTVSAAMFRTEADCIQSPQPPTCMATCLFDVMAVCEFHCSHFHTGPYPWPVRFSPSPQQGYAFVGWTANCEAQKDVLRSDCVLRWSSTQPQVSLTAHFLPTPDEQDPAPAPSVSATPQSYAANLAWTPSADQWLAGYDIFRNGAHIARVTPGTTSFRATNLLCQTAYTFRVDAFDWSGNEARSLDVPTTTRQCTTGGGLLRPNTAIHVKPPKVTHKKRAYFHFGARGEVAATKFQCKLDKRRWRRCSGRTGITYTRLRVGYHTFRVRAGNAAGWDRTPAKYTWRVRR